MESELGYRVAAGGMLLCLLASLFWPWITKTPSRPYQVGRAAGFALAATVLFLVYNWVIPKEYNIRVDLVLLVPALLIAWIQCIILALVRSQQSGTQLPPDA
jgi:hypothetical protein